MTKMLRLTIVVCTTFLATAKHLTLEQIFNEEEQKKHDCAELNRSCKELDITLEFIPSEEGAPAAYLACKGIKLPIPQKLLEHIYNTYIKTNPYASMHATMRKSSGNSLCQEEQTFTKKRSEQSLSSLELLLDQDIKPEHMPRTGLCLSGGGYRAMVCSSGLLYGLDLAGILDIVNYVSCLSGSTWAVSPWMLSEQTFSELFENLMDRAVNGFLRKNVKEHIHELKSSLGALADYFIRKLIFKDIPSIIDIYGYCLALTLLDKETKKQALTTGLHLQKSFIEKADRPLPLYTAVIPYEHGKHYSWLEFSPFEVANLDLNVGIPSWAYGRKFKESVSVTTAPPLSLGFLMGLWGSAVSVSFKEVYDMVIDKLEPHALFAPLKKLVSVEKIGESRIFPAKIRSFIYKSGISQKHDNEKRHSVVDAGIHFNLPIPPLCNKERDLDLIIILDASANIIGAPELQKAEAFAREKKLRFPVIDYTGITDKNISIFDDGPNSETPIVIYIPMIKNDRYSLSFDPQDHLKVGGFMNTFNFAYSKENIIELTGLFKHTAYEAVPIIIETLKTIIERKKTA